MVVYGRRTEFSSGAGVRCGGTDIGRAALWWSLCCHSAPLASRAFSAVRHKQDKDQEQRQEKDQHKDQKLDQDQTQDQDQHQDLDQDQRQNQDKDSESKKTVNMFGSLNTVLQQPLS